MPVVTENRRGRHWAITINNYTDQDVATLRAFGLGCSEPNSNGRYVAFGYEVAPETGTPHLQVAIGFRQPRSFLQVQRAFNGHITRAIAPLASYNYAIKGQATGDNEVEVFGQPPSNNAGTGSNNNWEALQDAIRNGALLNEVREGWLPLYARGSRAIIEYILQCRSVPQPEIHVLRDWQAVLYTDLCTFVQGNRRVTFVVGANGNDGKTWFTKYFRYLHPENTIVLRPTKKHDMAYIFTQACLQSPVRHVFIDASRSAGNRIPYDFIEELKDGEVTSGKYASFNLSVPENTNVVVFSNTLPFKDKLSRDRYDVRLINEFGYAPAVDWDLLPQSSSED